MFAWLKKSLAHIPHPPEYIHGFGGQKHRRDGQQKSMAHYNQQFSAKQYE
jgi:hypothetical protein